VTDSGGQLVDHLSTGVLLFDSQLSIVDVNLAAEAMLDISFNSARDLSVAELLPGAREFAVVLERVSRTGEPLVERELTLSSGPGEQVVVDCILTPLSESERPCSVLVELVSLDRRQWISRDDHLVAQNESARSVIRGLAHEIKNPLGGLRGAAQLLERELNDAGLMEYTQVIISEADRLQALVDRMLTPQAVPCPSRQNVHQVTERVRALIVAEAHPGISVERDYDPSIPDLEVDADLLIQALLNIARNSLQALGSSGRLTVRTRVERQLYLGARPHRLGARIDIHDNGPGVPAELIERVFYPMVSGRPDGTGLGLSIAQSLVNQQEGLIECVSQPGDTTFSVLLPVRAGW